MKLLSLLSLFFLFGYTSFDYNYNDSNPQVFVHPKYSGAKVNLWCSEPNLHRYGWGDKFSSCIVPQGWKLVFYEHKGFGGARFTVTSDVKYFDDYEWNDAASSVKVYYNGVLQKQCEWQAPPKVEKVREFEGCRKC